MKKMKKLASLLLAVVMVMAMGMTAMAAEAGTSEKKTDLKVTISNVPGDGYQYEAYQIFSGEVSTLEGKSVLVNIDWGDGIEVNDTLLGQLRVLFAIPDSEPVTAYGVASKLNGLEDDHDNAELFAQIIADHLKSTSKKVNDTAPEVVNGKYTYTISGLTSGYYFIKDADQSVGEGEAYTKFILSVLDEDAKAVVKTQVPTVDKQVQDEGNNAEAGAVDGWGETADHDLYETFQFKLIGELPEDPGFKYYDTYKMVFHDTIAKGIDYLGNMNVTATYTDLQGVLQKNKQVEENYYVVSEPVTNEETGITTFDVTFNDLKEFCDITKGVTIEITYDAQLTEDAVVGDVDVNTNKVYLEYSNNPNVSTDMGRATEDTVYVFTYEMKNQKVDGDVEEQDGTHPALAGAKFNLKNGNMVLWFVEKSDTDENGNQITYYSLATEGTKGATQVLVSGSDGRFDVRGLDAGTYTLVETEAPAGYNRLATAGITVTIEATHSETTGENQKAAYTDITMTNSDNGDDSVTENIIVNHRGVTLPETGGIGTTIFYVVGSILVLGAIVLLVTKKRMSKES